MALSVDKAMRRAQRYCKCGNLTKAEAIYKEILSEFPNSEKAIQGLISLKSVVLSKLSSPTSPPDVKIQELISLCDHGQFEEALLQLKPMIAMSPQATILLSIMGASNLALKKYDLAIESYKNILKIKPDHFEAYNNLGAVYKDKGKLEIAVKYYKIAVWIKPDYPEAYNNMGIALKEKGELSEAINCYQQALKIKPNFAEVYNNMGNALQILGKLERAIDSYKQALKITPTYAEACNNMGNALQMQGEPDAAINSYKQALKINSNYAEAYNNMGNALQMIGKLDAAIESCKQALAIKPNYAEAYNNMGNALKSKGKMRAATDNYKKALMIKPDYAEAQHLLASATGKTTDKAPRAYVENLFDSYASKFEHYLVTKLEYRIPQILSAKIFANQPNSSLGSVLDLGCGTGLVGVELREHCQNLQGVDLSNSMVKKTKEKNIYDKLTYSDITDFLSTHELNFDYFIAADVFIYVGNLSDVFRLISSRNKRCGKLIFSTEHTERSGFFLETSGRYSHSKEYIKRLCKKFDYRLSDFTKVGLRKEKDRVLIGGLYLLDF